jgi:hypothetical protein
MTRRALLVLAALFVFSLPAVTARIYATDEIQYFSYLRSLWFDHDVSFENEYRYFVETGPGAAPGFSETNLGLKTETGRRINFGTVGSALLWAPFYAIADLYVITARAAGSAIARDGYSHPYVAAVAYGSAVYGFAALALSLLAAVRLLDVSPGRALAAAIVIWIGTPLLFYMYLAPVFAHATSAFSVALFVTVWLAVRQTWSLRGLVALGAVGALMVMVREQDATYLIGPAIDFTWQSVRSSRAALVRAAVAGAVAVLTFGVVFVPQALAYLSLNGAVRPSRLVTRKIYWHSPHAFQILLSPEHGYFIWTPLAIVAMVGLVLAIRRLWNSAAQDANDAQNLKPLALSLAATVVAQIYLLGGLDSWTSAGGFGQRRFVGTTILLVIGMAALLDAASRGRRLNILTPILALAIYWNLAFMALFGTQLMDRQRIELGRNAYDAFVTLPRMAPSLVHRYLFDRQSFYKQTEELKVR